MKTITIYGLTAMLLVGLATSAFTQIDNPAHLQQMQRDMEM